MQEKTSQIEKIIERLKIFHGVETTRALGQILGVAESTMSGWKSRGTIDYELIFSNCEDLNLNWLIYGEGEMLRNKKQLANSNLETSVPELENQADADPASILLSLISGMIDRKLEGKVIEKSSNVKHLHNSDGVVLNPISKKVKK